MKYITIYVLFAGNGQFLSDKIPWDQALLAVAEMADLPPVALAVVQDLHAVSLAEGDVGVFAGAVVVEREDHLPARQRGPARGRQLRHRPTHRLVLPDDVHAAPVDRAVLRTWGVPWPRIET